MQCNNNAVLLLPLLLNRTLTSHAATMDIYYMEIQQQKHAFKKLMKIKPLRVIIIIIGTAITQQIKGFAKMNHLIIK